MRSPTASEILSAWESGLAGSRLRRSMGLLQAVAEAPLDDPARLSIGARDARLLALRRELFGSQLAGVATCPACDDWVEWSIDVDQLPSATAEIPESVSLELNRERVEFRLPNTADLEAVAELSEGQARRALLDRCLRGSGADDAPLPAATLSDELCEFITRGMAEADPCAELKFRLGCGCGHAWEEGFDIEAFLWCELESWAGGLLRDVHVLASAYGWTEGEILRLSPARRRSYIELVSS